MHNPVLSTATWAQSKLCSWFLGRSADRQPERKQGNFFASKNIGNEQQHTTHNSWKWQQFKYGILWLINFINGKKFRAVDIITPFLEGRLKLRSDLLHCISDRLGCTIQSSDAKRKTITAAPWNVCKCLSLIHRHTSPFQDSQSFLHTGACRWDHNTLLWADPSEQRLTKAVFRNILMMSSFALFFKKKTHTHSWFTQDGRFAITWRCVLCWLTSSHSMNGKTPLWLGGTRDLSKGRLSSVTCSYHVCVFVCLFVLRMEYYLLHAMAYKGDSYKEKIRKT